MLKLLFMSETEFATFNYYMIWSCNFDKLTEKEYEFMEISGKNIVKRINIWMKMLEIDLREKAN